MTDTDWRDLTYAATASEVTAVQKMCNIHRVQKKVIYLFFPIYFSQFFLQILWNFQTLA